MRFYATLKNTAELLSLYRTRDLEGLTRHTATLLRSVQTRTVANGQQLSASPVADQGLAVSSVLSASIRVVAAPSLNWRAAFVADAYKDAAAPDIVPDELIIVYETANTGHVQMFLDVVKSHRNVPLDEAGNMFLGAGIDPGASVADHWCPGAANLAAFGHRAHARRTIRANALTTRGLLGQRVNIAIIDEGLDKAHIPARNWGGGLDNAALDQPAGTAPRTSHGMMIARSILDLAPEARLYDVPAVPFNKAPVSVAISEMQAGYGSLIHAIQQLRTRAQWSGPWVLVNAWGVFDTSTDPSGSYTRNLESHGHPLINLITKAVRDNRLDIIFSAGNCGQFCPSQRCGGGDRGPGHSIWGANAHPLVITVGAVRSDETWVGYSSQGPGPETLAVEKPDLCAPSQFCETYDAASLSSGTSASCAITAGVVAALRSNPAWDQVAVTPEALRLALIGSARKPFGPTGWDGRLGFGILDAAATIDTLSV
jgi:subtilisin family serine protease